MSDEANVDELMDMLSGASALPPDTVDDAFADPPAEGGDEARKKKKKKSKKHRGGERSERKRQREDGSDDEDSNVGRSRFVIDAAESGESESDDDFVDDEEEEDDFDPSAAAAIATRREQDRLWQGRTAEDIEKEYKERAKAAHSGKDDELLGQLSSADRSSLRFTARMLPQRDDPKVFAVKCRPRMGRLLVARIVNKCYAYRVGQNFEKKKVDLGIISVFCLDHVGEYIYVEAYRKMFVENALNGLDGVFRFNITVVDPTELLQLMEHRPSNERLRVGNFVRLRQRFYRNDLAQVTAVHKDGVHITAKVVPRENFVNRAYNKAATRLPPRFFAPSLARDVRTSGAHYQWGDLKFDEDGYLLKSVSVRMVMHGDQMEKPTTEELALFFNNNRDRVREAVMRASAQFGAQSHTLRVGDSVRVISGQLRSTTGIIESIDAVSNAARIACRVPGSAAPLKLNVELSACAKHFTEGTHVIVNSGEHAGKSGTVVKNLEDVVVLFPDRVSTVGEIRVRANDCHRTNLVGTHGHSHGIFNLFDLVTISTINAVGCIISLNRTEVDVLTENNEVQTLAYAQIKPVARVGARPQTPDSMKNILTRGAEVMIQKVAATPFQLGGQSGRVEQLFNRTLFVTVRSRAENAGLVAIDARCVLLTGGRTNTKRVDPVVQLQAPMRRPHNATKPDSHFSFRHESSEWLDSNAHST